MNFTSSTLDITTRVGCPVSCIYCPQDKTIKNYQGDKVMSVDTLSKCLAHIPINYNKAGQIYPRIEFSGFCEPYANPNCSDLITTTYNMGFTNITLYTTLRGMRLSDYEKIKNIPLQFISIHLPDVNGYTNIPVDDEYYQLLDLLLDTYGIGFFAYGGIKTEVIDFILKKNPNAFSDWKWELNIHNRAGNLEQMAEQLPVKNGRIQCCKSPYMELSNNVLMPNGDVVLCCMDFGVKHKFGNLLTDDYMDLFKSEEHNKVVAGMFLDEMNSMCRVCINAIPSTRN